MHSHTVGVLIGRFQLPELHDGHLAFLSHVLEHNDETCVFVGVKPEPDRNNLLPYPAIRDMIYTEFAAHVHTLQVHQLPDIPGEDLQWSMQIDRFLELLYPGKAITLYAGRDGFKPYYHGKFDVKDWFGYNGEVSATKVRDEILNGTTEGSPAFRRGIIYGLGRYLRAKE